MHSPTRPGVTSDPNSLRQQALGSLASSTFDLLVVGGGITGCGIARDAALRGFSVALVEKTDFAAGTSSKSTKLIHGGLRYLEQGELKLVFESVNERALLMRRAPHLVRPLPFLVPSFRGIPPMMLKLDIGLWLYDGLCGFKAYRIHRAYRRKRLLSLEPGLRQERLVGGLVYYDCLTNDARLTLENALDAVVLGAVLVNHAAAVRLLRSADGRVEGAEVIDQETGGNSAPIPVKARVVVNASGPWSDEVRALMGERRILKPTKGVHIVVDAHRLPVRHAIVMFHPADRRVMFAIPWGNRSIVGTTDTFYDGSPDRLFTTREDADYLLDAANHYYPHAKLRREDVLSTWAGLRPLIAPDDAAMGASAVSREHLHLEHPGFLTIAGGKLTTYRRIAAEVVDLAARQLGKDSPSPSGGRQLPGAHGLESPEAVQQLIRTLGTDQVTPDLAIHLAQTYGSRAPQLLSRAHEDATAAVPLDPELPHRMAEVDEAVDRELARSVVDVLERRVPLLLRSRDQGLSAAPAVAERMARRLDWSPSRVREELDRYQSAVDDSRRFRS